MKKHFHVVTTPLPDPANVVMGEHYRLTFLTSRLVRLEYAESGRFEDHATQIVWNRNFPKVELRIERTEQGIEIYTEHLAVFYDEKPFSPTGLLLRLRGGASDVLGQWHYGDPIRDLKGTYRTLDRVNGDDVTLGPGILSHEGYAVLDDTGSLVLQEDGWVAPRSTDGTDLYFFGYGRRYLDALRDFYTLTGPTPMLPRFALGNWWSRYYQYTQSGYLELMDRFEKEQVPLSVAVIDMDWHHVQIDPKYGGGWTGFTWNPKFFPDHKAFLADLHRRGMKTTLNLHPADGIRGHEEAYERIARHMGVDVETEEPVPFDPTDPKFLQYYYEDVLNPMEAEGVDFWWVDWQQGERTKVPGLDPLWVLNHYDYLDSGREQARPLTFSRYSGPGSHRYPIGFSGDTHITWESLRFQPYFTATASNIGYGWWSHDIGGHMHGYKDDELMARWTQLGAFSPILRLHSSNSPFNGKEPWRFKLEAAEAMKQVLRLRHRMIPYLYTMCWRNHTEGVPLVQPLYYHCPWVKEAYNHGTEYFFGSELLVQPVTSKRIPGLNVAGEMVYLPEGLWHDVYNRRLYRGGRTIRVYRPLEQVPVFAKAGAIVPMTDRMTAGENPDQLHVYVYLGADGAFTLYEDDGESKSAACVKTQISLTQRDGSFTFRICPPQGDRSLIPARRTILVEVIGAEGSGEQTVPGGVLYTIPDWDGETAIEITGKAAVSGNDTEREIFDFLNQAEIAFDTKDRIMETVLTQKEPNRILSELLTLGLDGDLFGALAELLTAY